MLVTGQQRLQAACRWALCKQAVELHGADVFWRQVERIHGQLVGRHQHIVFKHQQQFLRAAELAAIVVQPQQPAPGGNGAFHPAVFNIAHRLADQPAGLVMGLLSGSGQIQNAGDVAVGAK